MLIVKKENVSPIDIDGTLIIHCKLADIPSGEGVQVYDAVTKGFITVRINRPMVRLVREARSRGDYVIAWSRGGYRWAADVIKALDLVDCVDLVLSKPLAYFDDTEVGDWMKYRVFLGPEVVYKQQPTNKEK